MSLADKNDGDVENIHWDCRFLYNTAFQNCSNLDSVRLPSSVTTILGGAFSGCHSLESLKIGSTVTTIGNYAFLDCPKLELFCEPSSQPDGWDRYWADSSITVHWGVSM